VDQDAAQHRLDVFLDSGVQHHTLGLVYGRRRIGKSTLLERLTRERGGFYWEATRGERAVHLARLGGALGEHLGVGRLSFENWDEALVQLLRLGQRGPVPVVLDEFGYLLEADPTVDSVIAAALGPGGRGRSPGQCRLILCGSALAVMGALTAGQSPLRGRAGVELVMQPFDYRALATRLGQDASLELATRVYSVIGGVIGYATDMVDHDLPRSLADFDRWVAERVLSPAATLRHEAITLLAEEPALVGSSSNLYHGILAGIANGSVTAGKLANRSRRAVSNLDPALKRLIATGFVVRHADPIRAQRPTYSLGDPFLQFHYAILEPHGSLLRHREPRTLWNGRLAATFDARVRGPIFEELCRHWIGHHAEPAVLGGLTPDHVGRSAVSVDGTEHELDVVVAQDGSVPSERDVVAIGEAKAGETLGIGHLQALERARSVLGTRAFRARLFLFGSRFHEGLRREAERRSDVELVDLARLYGKH
jgi:AAA+ ATPase superfamily predicted ATPase